MKKVFLKIFVLLSSLLLISSTTTLAVTSQTMASSSIEQSKMAPSQMDPSKIELSKIELSKIEHYVGELQKQWQFPSDHLPIGMSLEKINLASWNVLDTKYINWQIEKNSQGLSHSLIADENVYIDETKTLTVRDIHAIELVMQMIQHPSHRKHILSLQECSEPFLLELKMHLPSNFIVIANDGNAILIDTSLFDVIKTQTANIFSSDPERTIQDITIKLKENQQIFRIINVHIPGDPTKPSRYELTQYLAKTFDPAITTIAMGDMNFNEVQMQHAINISQKPFTLYTPYCTNISPTTFIAKAIDHFIVYAPNKTVTLHEPNQVMIGLSSTAKLLSK